jgi:amino acid transporter
MLWFAYLLAGALYAIDFGENFVAFLRAAGLALPDAVAVGPVTVPVGATVLGLPVVVAFGWLNALSTSASGGAETLVTLAKVAVLLVFAGFGAAAVDPANFRPFFAEGRLAVLPAMGLTFIAFEGYDLIATVTEEVENPRENIPRAIGYSLVATVSIYLLVVLVAVGTRGASRTTNTRYRPPPNVSAPRVASRKGTNSVALPGWREAARVNSSPASSKRRVATR